MLAPGVVGEAPPIDPAAPEAVSLLAPRVDLLDGGRSGRVGPAKRDERRLPLGEAVPGTDRATFDSHAEATGEAQCRWAFVGRDDVVVSVPDVGPARVVAPEVERRLAGQDEVDVAVEDGPRMSTWRASAWLGVLR